MNRQVFQYVDGQLHGDELHRFEQQMQESPSLQREVNELSAMLRGVKELDRRPDLEGYFAQSRARMLQKTAGAGRAMFRRLFFSPRISFATTLGVAVVCLIFLPNLYREPALPLGDVATLPTEEKMELLETHSAPAESVLDMIPMENATDEAVDTALAEEMNIDGNTAAQLTDDLNISTDELLAAVSSVDDE